MRIAVVDGYSTGKLVAAMLSSAGVGCIHVQSRKDTHPYYRDSFVPDDYQADLGYDSDVDRTAALLTGWGVSRVVAGTESGVELAARLGSLVGGPHDDPARAGASADKAILDGLATRAGIAVPLGSTFTSARAARAWMVERGLTDVVAKPVTSAGTDHVRFCAGPDALTDACHDILTACNVYGDPNDRVMVQERVGGSEYYVNTVSLDGVHRVAEAWRYTKRTARSGAPLYDFEEPVPPGSTAWQTLRSFVVTVLDALGIRSSPAHTEVIIRPDGSPVLVETGARLGGGTLPAVVSDLLGSSQAHLFVRSILDPPSLARFDERPAARLAAVRNVSLVNHQPGAVPDLGWQDFLRGLPTCVALSSSVTTGTWLPATSTLIDAPGYLYLASDDPAAVAEDYLTIREAEADDLYLGTAGTEPVRCDVSPEAVHDVLAKALQECQNGLAFRRYDLRLDQPLADGSVEQVQRLGERVGAQVAVTDHALVLDTGPSRVSLTWDGKRAKVLARRATRPPTALDWLAQPPAGTAPTGAVWDRAGELYDQMRSGSAEGLTGTGEDPCRVSAVAALVEDPSWLVATMASDLANRLGLPLVPRFVREHRPGQFEQAGTPGDARWTQRWEDRISVEEYAFYEAVHPGYGSQVYVAASQLARHARLPADRILDIGSGPGLPTIMFTELFPDAAVCAVEPSPVAYRHLAANCAGRTIEPAHADIADFRSARAFPAIVSVGTSHHLDTRLFFAAARNNLAPDGILVVADELVSPFRTPRQRSVAIAEHHLVYIEQALRWVDPGLLAPPEQDRLAVLRAAAAADVDELATLLDRARQGRGPVPNDAGAWQRVRFAVLELEALVAGLDYEVERKTWAVNLVDLASQAGFVLLDHEKVHPTVGGGEFAAGTHVFTFAHRQDRH
ncbi:methyltransferase domain-containing protein [Jatrophihabitans sp.]|uniref:methyltransferase domain-containing protein n=1 Tax=Jatrophihabitans sp. TaxID=1932789 RepID=UPI002BAC7878|nr:methyltransferase domain-containing protein [Jatrophihabitans sp.]